jgi:hypothetical protein
VGGALARHGLYEAWRRKGDIVPFEEINADQLVSLCGEYSHLGLSEEIAAFVTRVCIKVTVAVDSCCVN